MPKSNFNIIYMRKILLTYGDIKTINIGDYIQSIAAKQFFDDDNYIFFNRDELKLYKGEPAKVIMNAWMTYKPYNWPLHLRFIHYLSHYISILLQKVAFCHMIVLSI